MDLNSLAKWADTEVNDISNEDLVGIVDDITEGRVELIPNLGVIKVFDECTLHFLYDLHSVRVAISYVVRLAQWIASNQAECPRDKWENTLYQVWITQVNRVCPLEVMAKAQENGTITTASADALVNCAGLAHEPYITVGEWMRRSLREQADRLCTLYTRITCDGDILIISSVDPDLRAVIDQSSWLPRPVLIDSNGQERKICPTNVEGYVQLVIDSVENHMDLETHAQMLGEYLAD